MNFFDYLIVFGFMGLTFYVGSIFYQWVGSTEDFYVAGRKLTPFILAAVLTATNVNLYSFVGQAGIAYKHGMAILWQTWTGNMALVFSGLFVLPILRRLRIKTIPELLELRYSKGVRTFVAVIWVVRLAFWLGVISYAAAIAAQPITGFHSFTFWILIFSVIAIIYTMLGGMWSVAFTDVMQFVFMLLGALIVLPLAMSKVGWWPGLTAQLPPESLTLVTQAGIYNWKFILAIFLLGIEWACVDQGLLQRAFGAENTKTVARGLVLAGIITTPFALLWNIPGLASRILYPGIENADMAVPTLLANLLPNVILGLVVCGLISSHLSTISANLNGVATVFASDIYENILNRKATDREVLRIARIVTAITGIAMIVFAYLVPRLGGVVNAYLTIIAIMDMPLFIIAVIYGLLWKRANWQGAIAGYAAGALAGIIAQLHFRFDFNTTTFISAGIALLVTPIISLFSGFPDSHKIDSIWRARYTSEEEIRGNGVYHIVPKTAVGKLSLVIYFVGLLLFLAGVYLGSRGETTASLVATFGMIIYFGGGLWRAYTN
ncbi:MAG: sodium:solute symporter family protein [candidate division KSB1 bacterium]|nr:sodium:solute symporter family protein [candidate division KSB1 bacterium]MDZ7304027.1 sodium:solute symporter family protein [candidate division KSB1 bacterium]MDZ7313264.1 sodium:solute symporter family protein [candidate division KSB1 bacterium]